MDTGFAPAPVAAARDGKRIFLPRGAALPPNCVKCGRPAETPWKKKFAWHSPLLFLLLLFNIIIYLIVALIVRKTMEVNVPLCEIHHKERKHYSTVALVMILAALPAGIFIGSIAASETLGWTSGLMMFGIGLIFTIRANNYMHASKIDDQHGMLNGAQEPFLRLLPNRQG